MSDVSESEDVDVPTTASASPLQTSPRYLKQSVKKKERKQQARFLTVTGGIRAVQFGSLNRKRVRSAERQIRSKSDSNFGAQNVVEQVEHLTIEDTASNDRLRPDSGYCEKMAPSIKMSMDESQYSRKISVQSDSINFEDEHAKYTYKAEAKIQELITTEQTYVQNLTEIVEGYLKYMEESLEIPKPEGVVQMPNDLKNRNKYRIVFGNIRDIFEFHKKSVLSEMEKASGDVGVLFKLFEARRDHLKTKYGRFCLNKPKSEYIIQEHTDYFTLIRMAKNFQHNLNSHLMTPIQRVTRYPLLLQEIARLYAKAGSAEHERKVLDAYEIANEVAEYANNMMTAGRIRGFAGDVTRQGLLLMCGDVTCYKRRHALKKPKMRSCQLFVFQESIIVCEKDDQNVYLGASGSVYRPQLNYWTSFQINKVHVREVNRGPDYTPRFELERRDDGRRDFLRTDEIQSGKSQKPEVTWIVVQCDSELKRNKWLKVINDQIKELQNLACTLALPPKTRP